MTDDDRRWPSARQAIDDVEADAPRSPIDAVRRRFRRLSGSYLLVVQICLASVAAWVVATEVIGHVQPFFAPVAAVVTVTAGLGQRHRIVVELVIGVAVGILVGELLIGLIGRGTWQLALVVALAALSAALLDVGRLAVVQASTSAILIVTVLPSAGSTGSPAVNRFVDALVGGLFGLLATALVPANPVRRLNREVGSVLGELATLLDAAARALRWTDPGVAWTALQQARALQDPLEGARRDHVDGAGAVAALADALAPARPRAALRPHVEARRPGDPRRPGAHPAGAHHAPPGRSQRPRAGAGAGEPGGSRPRLRRRPVRAGPLRRGTPGTARHRPRGDRHPRHDPVPGRHGRRRPDPLAGGRPALRHGRHRPGAGRAPRPRCRRARRRRSRRPRDRAPPLSRRAAAGRTRRR